MIDKEGNPVEWAMLLYELEDAREHLSSLVNQMNAAGGIDEVDYAVQLGHVFAHLNRGWNPRSLKGEIPDGEREKFTRFPDNLDPVG